MHPNLSIDALCSQTRVYLTDRLLPFWTARAAEPKYGGFQTNYDRDGLRTAVTEKTLLCQGRCIFTLSHMIRHGFDWPGSRDMIRQGVDFLIKSFKDPEHDGYYWIVEEDGRPKDTNKVVYGLSFLIYGLSEHAIVTGDARSRQEACRLFSLLKEKASDSLYGGYYEHFDRTWTLKQAHKNQPAHKSLDVHMHLMEAFTVLYELTGNTTHRRALEEVIDLIFAKMLDRKTGTGISMLTGDWAPISNVELATVWGSDRFEKGKTADITSYGHNIEFAWLYLHAQDILGIPRKKSLARVVPIFDHTFECGVDWEYGGVYVEGPRAGEATETNKEFWQQAEAMVGFLDGYLLTRDERYLRAFRNIHGFVFEKMINWEQGEWFPLLDRTGKVLWDYMGHNWKICYHTMRAICLTVKKLEQVAAGK